MKVKNIFITTTLATASLLLLGACSSAPSCDGGPCNLHVTGYGSCAEQDATPFCFTASEATTCFTSNSSSEKGVMSIHAPENTPITMKYGGGHCATLPPVTFAPPWFTIASGGSQTVTATTHEKTTPPTLKLKATSLDTPTDNTPIQATLTATSHQLTTVQTKPTQLSLKDNNLTKTVKLTAKGAYQLMVSPRINNHDEIAVYPHTVHSNATKATVIQYLPTTNRLVGQITQSTANPHMTQALVDQGFNVIELKDDSATTPTALQTFIAQQQQLIQNSNTTHRTITVLLNQNITANTTAQQLLSYTQAKNIDGLVLQLNSYQTDVITNTSKVITQLQQQDPNLVIVIRLAADNTNHLTTQAIAQLNTALLAEPTASATPTGWFQVVMPQESHNNFNQLLTAGVASQHIVVEATDKDSFNSALRQYSAINSSGVKGLMISPKNVNDTQLKQIVLVSTQKDS